MLYKDSAINFEDDDGNFDMRDKCEQMGNLNKGFDKIERK